MSYNFNTPCWNCSKQPNCTDEARIREAITKIHQTTFEEGHQGSGQILLACTVQNKQK